VIIKVRGVPVQEIPPLVKVGVTVICAVMGADDPFVAVKAGKLPVPDAGNPIAVLELIHV
jgi:hypothetical protein